MMLEKTAVTAAGKWDSILMNLVPEIKVAIKTGAHIPCPVHGGTNGFRVFKDGSGGSICNTCGSFPDGFRTLEFLRGWDFKKSAREIDGVIGMTENDKQAPEKKDPMIRLKKIQAASEPAGEFVAQYLKGRGLSKMPPSLLQARLAYWEDGKKIGTYIAIVAKVISPLGKPVTYHLTYLQAGSKAAVRAPKKMLPTIGDMAGAAIRLWAKEKHIGIAEGIETAIAARERFSIPTWAVMNTAGMKSFIPPDGVEHLTIFADNDKNFAGQAAAYELANRLSLKGLAVEVKVPPELGDWLDVLNAG